MHLRLDTARGIYSDILVRHVASIPTLLLLKCRSLTAPCLYPPSLLNLCISSFSLWLRSLITCPFLLRWAPSGAHRAMPNWGTARCPCSAPLGAPVRHASDVDGCVCCVCMCSAGARGGHEHGGAGVGCFWGH